MCADTGMVGFSKQKCIYPNQQFIPNPPFSLQWFLTNLHDGDQF